MTTRQRPLTIPEAAEALGVSASTLRTQRERGKIRATKAGRDWLIEPREVERYRSAHLGRHQGSTPAPD